MMRRLPLVSAKKPHRYDDVMMPRNPTAPRIPLFCVVKSMSHCEIGNTKLIPHVSINTAFKMMPHIRMMK